MDGKNESKMCDSFPVISYKNFDVNKITFNELVTEDKNGNPKKINNFTMKYDGKPFLIQSPLITVEYGGVPQKESNFVETDDDRRKITIPLDITRDINITKESQEENDKRNTEMELFKSKMIALEELVQQEEVVMELFKTKDPSKYTMPWQIVSSTERGDKLTLKFQYDFPNVTYKKIDGSIEEINHTAFNEVDDFEKYISYLSKSKYIFSLRGWASKKPKGKQPLEYGIKLTLEYVLSNEKIRKVVSNNTQRFIDSDDDDDPPGNEPEPESVTVKSDDESQEKSGEDSNQEDDDEEELEEVKPKRRTRKKN